MATPTDQAAEVGRLASKALALLKKKGDSFRLIVGLAGIPGSGKTTIAGALAARINDAYSSSQETAADGRIAVAVPMDGFHLYRAQLEVMPDPTTAIHRRGAAFTFDALGFYNTVRQLREPISSQPVLLPSFDHKTKDPVEDDIAVLPEARIVIIEGLYLCLSREPWNSAAGLMDELWFIETERDIARARLVKRHIASGIVADEAAAHHRISTSDFLNADDVLENRLPIQEFIKN